jgi:hypothetical protein
MVDDCTVRAMLNQQREQFDARFKMLENLLNECLRMEAERDAALVMLMAEAIAMALPAEKLEELVGLIAHICRPSGCASAAQKAVAQQFVNALESSVGLRMQGY